MYDYQYTGSGRINSSDVTQSVDKEFVVAPTALNDELVNCPVRFENPAKQYELTSLDLIAAFENSRHRKEIDEASKKQTTWRIEIGKKIETLKDLEDQSDYLCLQRLRNTMESRIADAKVNAFNDSLGEWGMKSLQIERQGDGLWNVNALSLRQDQISAAVWIFGNRVPAYGRRHDAPPLSVTCRSPTELTDQAFECTKVDILDEKRNVKRTYSLPSAPADTDIQTVLTDERWSTLSQG